MTNAVRMRLPFARTGSGAGDNVDHRRCAYSGFHLSLLAPFNASEIPVMAPESSTVRRFMPVLFCEMVQLVKA